MAIDASDVIVFKSIRFRKYPFSSVHTNTICTCMRFQLCSLSTVFSHIYVFSVNTLSVFERISVDGRPKRIEMYAFSNENALVWTGP